MTSTTTKPDSWQPAAEMAVDLFDNWFDPIETEVRARAREFIEEMIRGELDTVLARPRYSRSQVAGNEGRTGIAGHRHGSRTRSLTGTFGPIEIAVPRARLNTTEGKTTEWKSQALRAYQRRTLAADALIASTYLAGTSGVSCRRRGRFRSSCRENGRGRRRAFSGLRVRTFRRRGPVCRAAGSLREDVRRNTERAGRRALRRPGHVRRYARAVK
jgi:hypothetical protein